MLEIYCDSSFNAGSPSYIGCIILKDGVEIHQSTTRVIPDPIRNLECELAAIRFAVALAPLFGPGERAVIYNDSTEAVKEFRAKNINVEFVSRDHVYQSVADRLSKKFPQVKIEAVDLCKRPVESFTPDVLKEIAQNKKPVLYLRKDPRESTNTKTVYRLVIRTIDEIFPAEKKYVAKAGEVKNVKVAREIARDLENMHDISLDGAYFLLTDETWGLRLKGGEAYSILPCSVSHHVICHEVDRTPDNLFERASALLNKG